MQKRAALFFLLVSLGFWANAQVYNIKDYGAIGDGQTMNTIAIQTAVDAASAKGGGKVVIPPGNFLSGTIKMKSGVELSLDRGATLLGSTNLADYERYDRWYALLLADKQNNIAVTGYGTIDGQGATLAKNVLKMVKNGSIVDPLKNNRPDEHFRPQLVEFRHSTGIKMQHITLKNAACWVETYDQCTDMLIDSITVSSTAYWNNDGIDIVDCKNVKMKNCNINAADDGICLKSSDAKTYCDNFEISDCKVRSSASAIKFGTASVGGFKNIRINNINIYDTYRVAVALEIVDGGAMENIDISNINAKHTGGAIFIRLGQRNGPQPGSIKNIHISNVNVEIPRDKPDAGYDIAGPEAEDVYRHNMLPNEIAGLPGFPVKDVTLENINVTFGGGADKNHAYVSLDSLASIPEREKNYPEYSMFGELPAWGFYARHAEGITLKNVTLKYIDKDFRPAIVLDDVKDISFTGLNIPTAEAPVIVSRNVTGLSTKDLKTPVAAKKAIILKP